MAGQALPQEGGANSSYYKPFPLLSWDTLYTHLTILNLTRSLCVNYMLL